MTVPVLLVLGIFLTMLCSALSYLIIFHFEWLKCWHDCALNCCHPAATHIVPFPAHYCPCLGHWWWQTLVPVEVALTWCWVPTSTPSCFLLRWSKSSFPVAQNCKVHRSTDTVCTPCTLLFLLLLYSHCVLSIPVLLSHKGLSPWVITLAQQLLHPLIVLTLPNASVTIQFQLWEQLHHHLVLFQIQSSIQSPPVVSQSKTGHLYAHFDSSTKTYQYWMFRVSGQWEPVSKNMQNPLNHDWVQSICTNGEPSWVTWATTSTTETRWEKWARSVAR